jgi:hypothetical protein
MTWTTGVFWLVFLMVFALVWLMMCIENLSHMVVMISSADYYFSGEGENNEAKVFRAWRLTYCNHFGSVAIGSFLCAIMFVLKWTAVIVCQYIEKMSGENAVVKCFTGCAACIISTLEMLTDYLTNSAFCYIACTGDSFCYGAYNSFIL